VATFDESTYHGWISAITPDPYNLFCDNSQNRHADTDRRVRAVSVRRPPLPAIQAAFFEETLWRNKHYHLNKEHSIANRYPTPDGQKKCGSMDSGKSGSSQRRWAGKELRWVSIRRLKRFGLPFRCLIRAREGYYGLKTIIQPEGPPGGAIVGCGYVERSQS
jgi:hypothetical protein